MKSISTKPKSNMTSKTTRKRSVKPFSASRVKHENNLRERKDFFMSTISSYCDKCGTPYSYKDIQIVQDNNSVAIIHFSCSNCLTNHLANYVVPIGAISRIPISSDLTPEEVPQFLGSRAVSTDDVLSIYELLKSAHTPAAR